MSAVKIFAFLELEQKMSIFQRSHFVNQLKGREVSFVITCLLACGSASRPVERAKWIIFFYKACTV